MYEKIGLTELDNILYGSTFFGGGGGGSMSEGKALIEEMKKTGKPVEIPMIKVESMKDGEVSVMVAALGSPIATKGRTFQDESVNAVRGMEEEAKTHGKELKYIYSGEQGGGNTMLPIYAAFITGKPLLDTDGNGRAVPELNTGLLPVHGVPTSPVVLASEMGDVIVGRTKDPMDGKSCEKIARYMCQAYDQGIGFAAWLMDREDHLAASAIGQMSLTINIGKALKTSPDKVIGALESAFKGTRKFKALVSSGVITDIEVDAAGGFDTGVTTIKSDNGEIYKITFQNENLFVTDQNGKVVSTIPNIISILVFEGDKVIPVSNSETKIGQRVALTVTEADKRWYDMEECYGCWNDVMISAGYCKQMDEVDL